MAAPVSRFRPVTSPATTDPVQSTQSDSLFRLLSQVRGASYRHPVQQSVVRLQRGITENGEYTFYFEPGRHILRQSITVATPYVMLAGDAPQSQEVQRDVVTTDPLITITGDYVLLRNLWFTDAKTDDTVGTIRVAGGTQVVIEACVFDTAGLAIEVADGVEDVTVRGCVFSGSSRSVWLRGTGARHKVVDNRFIAAPAVPDAAIYADDTITDSLYDANVCPAASSLVSVKLATGYSIGTAIGGITVRP